MTTPTSTVGLQILPAFLSSRAKNVASMEGHVTRLPPGNWRFSGQSNRLVYAFAALCGIATGCADVAINDLLFTALLVLAACMLLGTLRPRWPWRWVIAVVVFIPLTEWIAYAILGVKPTRGQAYGAFLTALPGVAGAYGGSVMRRVLDNLRQGK